MITAPPPPPRQMTPAQEKLVGLFPQLELVSSDEKRLWVKLLASHPEAAVLRALDESKLLDVAIRGIPDITKVRVRILNIAATLPEARAEHFKPSKVTVITKRLAEEADAERQRSLEWAASLTDDEYKLWRAAADIVLGPECREQYKHRGAFDSRVVLAAMHKAFQTRGGEA